MKMLNTYDNASIHTGVGYNRIEHAERIEALYINPSNLWRIAKCPASARKICRAADHIKQSARVGLTVDRIVTEAEKQGKTPREVAPEASENVLKQADGYFRILQKLKQIHPDAIRFLEMELAGDWIENFQGIADCVLYVPDKQRLLVIDHKTGRNTEYAADDLQLRCYAVMAYDQLTEAGYVISEVYTMIVQPDLPEHGVRTTRGGVDHIEKWRDLITSIVQKAAENPEEAHPDCYRCLFCPWASKCASLAAFDEENEGQYTKYKTRVLRPKTA